MSADKDLIRDLLERVMKACPEFTPTVAEDIERQIRHDHGGTDYHVRRTPQLMAETKRTAVINDYIRDLPLDEIQRTHRISRRTIYRYIKKA